VTAARVQEEVAAVRRAAGVFALVGRGLLAVEGADRVRFLQGQLTGDVASLDPDGPRSGCRALALTPQGRIVADLHVLARPGEIWLETEAVVREGLRERLARYVIADDVVLRDRSAELARFGVEGPRAAELLAAASGAPAPPLAPDAWRALRVAGREVVVAAFGWSGEPAYQLFVPVEACGAVEERLRADADRHGWVWASPEALEVLRIEAGEPRAGAELGPHALPAEVGLLERAVSFTKGCYTGQEVVARMHSRGRVGHLLVGLRREDGGELPAGAAITVGGTAVGEVTSSAHSPGAGAIALGFVRFGHHAPGTRLEVAGRPARVVALPFVRPARGGAAGA
jgi:folate-binding protein YgfZ